MTVARERSESEKHEAREDRGPEPSPPRPDVAGVLALQRSAGNAAVSRALAGPTLQRAGGWTGKDVGAKSPNRNEMEVKEDGGKSARRIPIEGIPEGNVKDDSDDTATERTIDKGKPTERKETTTVSQHTSEEATGGRAIVVIPTGVKLGKDATLDVLIHLHGHTTGYRKAGKSTRDLGVERIEQQVAAAAGGGQRSMIAVLPQGGFHSQFGKSGKSFDPTAYLDSVWRILGTIGVWDPADPPKRGGLMLSSHSGGDAPLEDMLAKAEKSGTGEVADLQGLFLLDTMYGKNDAAKMLSFVQFRLKRDLAHLGGMRSGGKSDADLVDWVRAHGFRLRGAHSGGHYKPQMKALADGLAAFMAEAETEKVIGKPGAPVNTAVAANLQVDPTNASGGDHDSFVGLNDNLRKSLEMMPGAKP